MNPATTVTGVLITGKTDERFPLAKRAVHAWQRQLFNSRHELLVINDHPYQALFPAGTPVGIREIRVPGPLSLGALRNIGIAEARSDYLVQWDDDDFSHPSRLLWQMEHTKTGRASILKYEVHCDLTGKHPAFVNNGQVCRCRGFAGTMLWPRSVSCRFPDKGRHEDTEFVLQLQKNCGVDVLENDPTMYCRFFHGYNTWTQDHIMKPKPGSRKMSAAEQRYIQQLVGQTTEFLAQEKQRCVEKN